MKNNLRFQVFIFTATRVVLNTMYRMVYPFLAAFGRGMGVDLPTLTLALTARSLAGVFGPIIGSLGDTRGRKTGMLFGLSLFIIGVCLVVIWPTFLTFMLALILSVVGKFAYDPSMQAYLGDRVAYQQRGRVLAITELGWSLSFIIGVPLMGFLISRYGWKAPFPVLTLLGLGAFGVLAWMVPGDKVRSGVQSGLWRNLRKMFSHPPVVAGLVMALLIGSANEMINLVFGVWLENSFGLMIAALGAASAVIGLAELSGESFAAAFTDRLGKSLAVSLGLGLNCLAVLALPLLGTSSTGAVIGLFFFFITFEYAIVSSIPMMSEVMPSARATVMAVAGASVSLGRALGALIGTPLYLFSESSPVIPDLLPNAVAAIIFNLLGIIALRYLQLGIESQAETPVI
ncbi:MAG: MFS transporter [Chloroflexota bacterium]|nr:MAG: MFS transporter [Chloroflexota bacterium]